MQRWGREVSFLVRRILGPGNKNLGKLVEVMVLVLAGGNELSSQDTRQRMALLLQQMQTSVPPQVRHLELLLAVLVTAFWGNAL